MNPSLWKLFSIFFRVGAFTFGGGYAMVPIIQKELVEKSKILTNDDFIDILGVCQSMPGAIATNVSAYAGYKIARYKGALACILGTISPSVIVILFIARFYQQIVGMDSIQLFFLGVRPAIVALLFVSLLKLLPSVPKTGFSAFIIIFAIIALHWLEIHPIIVIISCMIAGLVSEKRKESSLS
ncbi:chromate transporter [Tindallia magadiensis]|uniref:Chromate transporter n=1 Tax=Tindallia magadiensis TaxID=69895 RepID=A0A1I3B888_9FIRM|nr:chromate transporter [Tindallia magadiensis]SFH58488.1 chromate transporter [Tindallia magadiensis]